MSDKIEITREFFIKILVEKLTEINKNLCEVDEILYNETHNNCGELFDEWQKVREATLEIEELIDALK